MPLLVGIGLVLVVIVARGLVARFRRARARRRARPVPAADVADSPLNPLEARRTRPWRAAGHAVPTPVDTTDSGANTRPLTRAAAN
jgi:hypothetical protein